MLFRSVFVDRFRQEGDSLVSGTHERIALLAEAIHEYLGLAFYRLKGWI